MLCVIMVFINHILRTIFLACPLKHLRVPTLNSLCFALARGNKEDLEIKINDVNVAFQEGKLNKEIYVKQAEGYVSKEHPNHVYLLIRSIYGLKQAPLVWNATLDAWLCENGFTPTQADPCIYYRVIDKRKLIICVYIDDLIILCKQLNLKNITNMLAKHFSIKNLDPAKSILGIEIIHDREAGTLKLRQHSHIIWRC